MTAETPACPECAAGKHRNCFGEAWNYTLDEPAKCPCTDPEHSR